MGYLRLMKSDKKLKEVFDSAKHTNIYYSFKDFKTDAKQFIKDIRNYKVIAGMYVSRSGMLRRFNVDRYNMLLNICYNQKMSWDSVKVTGCGMDMWWHLLFTACEDIATHGENEKYHLNSKCSSQKVL